MSEVNEMEPSPEARADAAARDLADRGIAVTARAVREAAGVGMAVASQAAKAWKEATAEDEGVTIPETPEDVRGRLDAIWADAYRAALAAVTPERDRLAQEAKQLRADVEALTITVTEVETERDQAAATAAARIQELETGLAAAQDNAQEANTATTAALARVEALESERDRLDRQLNALIAKLPSSGKKKGD